MMASSFASHCLISSGSHQIFLRNHQRLLSFRLDLFVPRCKHLGLLPVPMPHKKGAKQDDTPVEGEEKDNIDPATLSRRMQQSVGSQSSAMTVFASQISSFWDGLLSSSKSALDVIVRHM